MLVLWVMLESGIPMAPWLGATVDTSAWPRTLAGLMFVMALIALGKCLGLRRVAEGVETVEQRNFLQTLSCDEIQGYLVGRPMPVQDFAVMLKGESER